MKRETHTRRSSVDWRKRRRPLRWAREQSGGIEWRGGQRSGWWTVTGLRPPGTTS